MMQEAWLPVPGHPQYEVSSEGNVRHIPWRLDGKVRNLKLTYNKGYPYATVRADGRHKKLFVHRLVLTAFRGEPPEYGMQACHLDGDRANCRIANLVWGSAQTNTSHKRLHGTWPGGERNRLNKLRIADINVIREQIESGRFQKDIAADFGVSRSAISMIKTGATWSHVCKLTRGVRIEIK